MIPKSAIRKNKDIKNKNNRKNSRKYRDAFKNFIDQAKDSGDFIYTFALLGFGFGGLVGVSIGVLMVKVFHNYP